MKYSQLEENDLIEKYFDFELNDSELEQFDHSYENNTTFKQKVLAYEQAKRIIGQRYDTDTYRLIRAKRLELSAAKKVNDRGRIRSLWGIGLVAGLIILIGTTIWMVNQDLQDLNGIQQAALEIAEATTNVDELARSIRSADGQTKNQLWNAYNQQNWQEVITLTRAKENSSPALLLQGIAYFHQKNYAQALQSFDRSGSLSNGIDDNLSWWRSITYLKMNDPKSAAGQLQNIIDNDYPSAHRAKELLQTLNAID